MGVSHKTVGYWIARFKAEGAVGLHDRSSRPHRSPACTTEKIEAELVRLRETERLGRDELAARAGVSPRTASRILARRAMPHLAQLDAMTGQLIRSSKQTAIRYQRESPGEWVHMDVKKLGRIPGGGWKAHGRQRGSTRARKLSPIGYDYVHFDSQPWNRNPADRSTSIRWQVLTYTRRNWPRSSRGLHNSRGRTPSHVMTRLTANKEAKTPDEKTKLK
jgi:hypothetical protein